ncbi:MAG: bifunctional 4-hydroxy-2-oxoglutarate aldolase/2-dehydro-3-deoxy-phosphogluconate aldolase [Chlorobiota bacterium]|jgi:2-dehydro-3-deoxyphosphogluconate aldolase/(4S)-4-hydroxy-2-oxoglutarate aldolase|nr:bifunctional 4-hydroxy-2-oxoglutarate aldolase/2-dehydro-3-deoxy-phosphogluconate aldolase [Chlorobiota bacterium]QQS66378.1 MAG: bifunctional 4-hydroxy-2-oxoglutarate aldolase/2-dehydro-3-deoxy-phosphogluconate aldolase [Chlorobiota bacterium]
MKDFLMNLKLEKLIAVVREPSFERGLEITNSLLEIGVKNIEITLTTPNAFKIVEALIINDKNIFVGIGSVFTKNELLKGIDLGISFYASPIFNKDLVELAKNKNVISMPGALSPTEIFQANALGADIIKIFPMPCDGVNFIKSILAPMPFLKIAPSGGVNHENICDYINAGATAVNVGTWLTSGSKIDITNKFNLLKISLKEI